MEEKQKKSDSSIIIVIAVVILIIIGVNFITNMGDSKNKTQDVSYDKNEEEKLENPYKVTDEYDGIYKFELKSDNGSGTTFTSKGVIEFYNGISKVKYFRNNNTVTNYDLNNEGYCGINKEENSKFYFSIGGNSTVYECTNKNNNLLCKLKSEFDLTGNSNNELNLTYIEGAKDIDSEYLKLEKEEKERIEKEEKAQEEKKEKEEKAQKEKEEKDFKKSCKKYTFEQMARNPDKFKGTNVKLTGEVVQVIEGTLSTDLRVNITKEGTYSTYYTDTIYVTYYPEDGEDKILEDDIITIYGTSQGDYTYTSTLGAPITLPYISAKYIELKK